MNKLRQYITAILFFIATLPGKAQESYNTMADIPGFRSKLEAMSESVQTISCDFIQEKNLVVLSEKIISRGIFFFKKENNIRWEYTQPYKYLIIITNGQLFTKDEKNRRLYDIESNRMFQEMNRFISGCIKGDILRNEKEYAGEYFENSNYYLVKLVPRDEKMRAMLNEVRIWFDKKDLMVSSLKMTESAEDYTSINFINRKLNTPIPIEKFSFN